MADPFDIYRTGAMGAESGAAPAAMDAAGEAARQRALLGLRVREMMGTGSAAAPEAAAAEAPGMVGRAMAKLPGFGATGRFLATKVALPLGIGAGLVKSATDTPEEVKANADQQGIDFNSFGGRVGANVLNTAANVGNAVTGGLAGWVGDKISGGVQGIRNVAEGGTFFDPVKPAGGAVAKPAPGPGANTAMDREDANDFAPNPGFGAVANAPAAPALAPAVPFTAGDVRGNRVPAAGTGAFMNNSTGAVTNLDTRPTGPEAPVYPQYPMGSWANGMGALMNIHREQAAASGAAAKYKIDTEFGAGSDKQASANKTRAETASIMERQRLAAAEPDPIKRAAILAGHTPPVDQHVFLPTMDANKVDVGTKATGAVQRVTVQPKLTEENIQASMKGQKMSREQVLAAYKTKGYDVSGMR